MARKSVIDSTIAQDMTDANDNFIELYQTKDEVETARDGESTLLAKEQAQDTFAQGILSEVETARDGESTLLAKEQAQDASITSVQNEVTAARKSKTDLEEEIDFLQGQLSSLASGSGVVIDATDSVGFLEDKLSHDDSIEIEKQGEEGNRTLLIKAPISSLVTENQANIILEAFRRMEADAYAGANAFQNGWTDALNDNSNIESITGFLLNGYLFNGSLDDLCVGGTASGSPALYSGSFANMFDDNIDSHGWWDRNNGPFLPAEVIYQFTSQVQINILRFKSDSTESPKDFTFYGSNDGSTWTSLGSFVAEQSGDWQEFNISNASFYVYYKIVITTSYNSWDLTFYEIEMKCPLVAGDVIFKPLTCVSEPTEQRVLMIAEYDDSAVTLNTDLIVSVSNDDGTTWEDVTMSVSGDFSSTQKILDGSKVMASVGGTKAKVKVTCTDTGSIKIHDIANLVKL